MRLYVVFILCECQYLSHIVFNSFMRVSFYPQVGLWYHCPPNNTMNLGDVNADLESQPRLEDPTCWSKVTPILVGWSIISVFWQIDVRQTLSNWRALTANDLPVVHGAMGCGQKSFMLCRQLLFGFLAKGHLPRTPRQTHLSTNHKGDNEMILGAVHISLGIYLKAEEIIEKPQVGDRRWKLCDQSSPEIGSLAFKWSRLARTALQECNRKERRRRQGERDWIICCVTEKPVFKRYRTYFRLFLILCFYSWTYWNLIHWNYLTNSLAYGTRGSMPHSQGLSNNPNPKPNQPNYNYNQGSILILSSYLRLGLPKGLFPVGFPVKILKALLLTIGVLK